MSLTRDHSGHKGHAGRSSERGEGAGTSGIAPGKATRTGHPSVLSGAVMQRKAATSASASIPIRSAAEWTMDPWTDAAVRGTTPPEMTGRGAHANVAVQAKSSTEQESSSQSLPMSSSTAGGHPLPVDVQSKMEHALGADFSAVRIHEGQQATALGALAYTQGTDIHFAPGQYQPGSQRGQELLGHELTHVVQQSQGRVSATTQAKGVGVNDDARLEREADEMGTRAARGDAGSSAPSGAMPVAGSTTQRAIARFGRAASPAQAAIQMWRDPQKGPTKEEIAAAIGFNKKQALPESAWKQIAPIVGATSSAIDEELVRKLGEWQTSRKLEADGKAGDTTLQWLSQQPGGKGLEVYVKSNATVYLGMNPGARENESATLKAHAGHDVEAVLGSAGQDRVKAGSSVVDLTTPEGRKAFVSSLPDLNPSKATSIEKFLEASEGKTKDELARLVELMNEAETGKRLIKRMVLSGHSAGWSVVGDAPNNGSITFQHLATISSIFPMAVGQVEDLMLSACNTGQKSKLTQYTKIFPNLKSIWAYVGYSPSPPGSSQHIARWESASRGAMNPATLNAARTEIAKGSGKNDKNALVWTRDNAGAETYDTASPESGLDYTTLRSLVDNKLPHFDTAFKDGKIDRPALDDLYTGLQNLVGNHRSSLGADADKYEKIMKQTLFLRYWSKVAKGFMETFGSEIASAYQAVSAKVPPYASATREATLNHINSYPGKDGDKAKQLLQDYLRDLDPKRIPDTWF